MRPACGMQILRNHGARMLDSYQRLEIQDQDEEFISTLGRHMSRPAYKPIMIDIVVFGVFMLFNALLAGGSTALLIALVKIYPRYEYQSIADIVITILLIGVVGAILVCQACATRMCNELGSLWRTYRSR